jgi:hypothetical protein
MIAVAGAVMVLSTLLAVKWGFKRSFAAFDFTKMIRAGKQLSCVPRETVALGQHRPDASPSSVSATQTKAPLKVERGQ